MKFKKIAALLGAFTIASSLFIAGCGNTNSSQKVWRVGTDATYAPFGFKDKDSGKLAGFDIDIINAIANEEGIEADIQNLNFDALLPALQSNTIDIAISDMTISEERVKSVDFSKPYYIAGNGLVVNIDNTNIMICTENPHGASRLKDSLGFSKPSFSKCHIGFKCKIIPLLHDFIPVAAHALKLNTIVPFPFSAFRKVIWRICNN